MSLSKVTDLIPNCDRSARMFFPPSGPQFRQAIINDRPVANMDVVCQFLSMSQRAIRCFLEPTWIAPSFLTAAGSPCNVPCATMPSGKAPGTSTGNIQPSVVDSNGLTMMIYQTVQWWLGSLARGCKQTHPADGLYFGTAIFHTAERLPVLRTKIILPEIIQQKHCKFFSRWIRWQSSR